MAAEVRQGVYRGDLERTPLWVCIKILVDCVI